MQNINQMNSEIRELTDLNLEAIDGAGIGSWIVGKLRSLFGGDGDHRRALDQPSSPVH